MVSLILTPKTAVKGRFATALPVAESSTVIAVNNVYQENVSIAGHGIEIPDGSYAVLILTFKNTNGGVTSTIQFRQSDGTTVLGTTSVVGTTYTRKAILFKNNTGATMTGIRLYVTSPNSTTSVVIEAESLYCLYAQQTNLTDILNTKMQVSKIHFFSSGSDEGLDGFKSTLNDLDFTTIDVNAVKTSIVWSANSGNTIFTWEGSTIGVSA